MPLTPNVYLEFDIPNKRARVIDNTNYADNDIVLASQNAKGLGVVTGPTGAAIINGNTVGNPLVNLAVSTNGQYFNLPLDGNGEVLNGTYAFTYAVRYANTGSIDTITAPSTAQLEFANAGAVLQDGDPIVFTGNANVNNNGTFTIATATYDLGLDTTTITVDQTTLVNASPATGSFSYDVTRSGFATGTYTWNGCTKVTPTVTVTYNCESTQFGQIIFSDSSSLNGQELVSRSLTGFYPNALNPAPPTESVTTSTTSLTFNELAVGTWTHNLTLVMTYTQPDGLVVNYTVVDTGETKVTCVGTLCGLTPCIESIKDKYAVAYNTGKVSGLEPVILMILQLYALAKEYRTCGEYEKYASTVAELEQVLDKSGHCECGCCDESKDVPYWVDNSNLDTPSAFEQLQDQVDQLELALESLEEQVDNADQFLQEQIDGLDVQVGGLESVVQSNASALLAYNAISSDIIAFIANVLALSNSLNTIQSQILALNPNSESFADDVNEIEALLILFESSVSDLDDELQDIVDSIVQFNSDYPEYSAYTVNLAIQYSAAANALSGLPTDIDALQVLLASLTPTTYDEDIEDIYNTLDLLISAVTNLSNASALMQYSIEQLWNTIVNINTSIANLQEQINALPQNIVSSKVQPLYADVNVGVAIPSVPPKYLAKGGYVKFIIKGQDPTPAGTEITIKRIGLPSPDYTLYTVTVEGKTYEIEIVLIPELSSLPITFKAGGMIDINNNQTVISVTGINSTTQIVYEAWNGFSIESNSISNVFNSIEVYGYDLTFG